MLLNLLHDLIVGLLKYATIKKFLMVLWVDMRSIDVMYMTMEYTNLYLVHYTKCHQVNRSEKEYKKGQPI